MANRYERVLSLSKQLWTTGSPLLFDKGALLFDQSQNSNVLQLQFKNVGSKKIIATELKVISDTKEILTFNYVDLNCDSNDVFGSQTLIVVNDKNTRNFEFIITKVTFSDNTTWSGDSVLKEVSQPKELNYLGALREQFLRDIRQERGGRIDFIKTPTEHKNYWFCSCGFFNVSESCTNCGIDKQRLFQLSDIELLKEHQLLYEEEEKKKREILAIEEAAKKEQLQQAQRAHKKKMKKNTIIVAVVVCIALLSLLTVQIFIPTYDSNKAIKHMENEEYSEALVLFRKHNEFRNNWEMIRESKYLLAISMQDSKEYDSAISAFQDLYGYKDSEQKINECKYSKAVMFKDSGNYEEAIILLAELSDPASMEMLKDCTFLKVFDLADRGEFDQALILLNQIPKDNRLNLEQLAQRIQIVKKIYDINRALAIEYVIARDAVSMYESHKYSMVNLTDIIETLEKYEEYKPNFTSVDLETIKHIVKESITTAKAASDTYTKNDLATFAINIENFIIQLDEIDVFTMELDANLDKILN